MGSTRKTPLLAVSMGDPAGIGAEVILKAAAALRARRGAPLILVVGDLGAMRSAAASLGDVPAPREWLPGETVLRPGRGISVLAASRLAADAIRPAHPTIEGAAAAYAYIVGAAKMAMRGEVDALVTAPINKEWMNRAGRHFPGHSELLAKISRTRMWRMMFAGGDLTLALDGSCGAREGAGDADPAHDRGNDPAARDASQDPDGNRAAANWSAWLQPARG